MKIAFIRTDWNDNEERREYNLYGGVGYYRMIAPAKYLPHDVDVWGSDLYEHQEGKEQATFWKEFTEQYDCIVTKVIDDQNAAAKLFWAASYTNTPIITDVDDNFLAIEPWQHAYTHYQPGAAARLVASTALSLSDALFVSTEPLKWAMQQHLQDVYNLQTPIYVLPNCNEKHLWRFARGTSDYTTLGWSGSITHDKDLEMIMPVLRRVLREYEHVDLQFLGGVRPGTADSFFSEWEPEILNKIYIHGGTTHFKPFPERLMSTPFDIGLAPLIDCEFNRCKSHIRWMEYANMGIPTVASPVYPYHVAVQKTPTIEDGRSGLLAADQQEWYDHLTALIEDKQYRADIGEAAKQQVHDQWEYAYHIHKWDQAICEVASGVS